MNYDFKLNLITCLLHELFVIHIFKDSLLVTDLYNCFWNELGLLSFKEFNWERVFSNTNVNEKVDIFNNRTVLNIISNFISHETIVCNDKDPPWSTTE